MPIPPQTRVILNKKIILCIPFNELFGLNEIRYSESLNFSTVTNF